MHIYLPHSHKALTRSISLWFSVALAILQLHSLMQHAKASATLLSSQTHYFIRHPFDKTNRFLKIFEHMELVGDYSGELFCWRNRTNTNHTNYRQLSSLCMLKDKLVIIFSMLQLFLSHIARWIIFFRGGYYVGIFFHFDNCTRSSSVTHGLHYMSIFLLDCAKIT